MTLAPDERIFRPWGNLLSARDYLLVVVFETDEILSDQLNQLVGWNSSSVL